MTDQERAVMKQALEALEIGYEVAKAEADRYYIAMAGFRPESHAKMDAEVQQIAQSITALRAALAEPVQEPGCDHCNHPLYYRCFWCGAGPSASHAARCGRKHGIGGSDE